MPKIVDVHEIRKNPTLSNGYIGVIGKVAVRDDKSEIFLLVDSLHKCKEVPMVYKGQKPEEGTEIIAYGHFRKVDRAFNEDILWWEYFLAVNKIKARDEIFSGNLFYVIRQWGQDLRVWLYKKCKHCLKIKQKLIPSPLF